MPSEKEEKLEQEAALSGEVTIQKINLNFQEENDRTKSKKTETPVGCVKDIPSFVTQLLDKMLLQRN